MKRAVVLFGAGASFDYKAPMTDALTTAIEREVLGDPCMKNVGGDAAFTTIKTGLTGHLRNPCNFEQIYHCAHELIFTFPPTAGASDEFRPLLYPFMANKSGITQEALRALVNRMAEVLFAEVSVACGKNPLSLKPLGDFIRTLRDDHVTRIYTTNYDDFPLQAVPDLYTGFGPTPSTAPQRFEIDTFWDKVNLDSIFHLHGSVHMGFTPPSPAGGDIGELFWFDDRTEALKHSSFSGGTRATLRMDGSSFMPTAVITGLDKLSRLQQRPLSHFYLAMARDMMLADVIYVIGSGLGDLHLNTWLRETRSRTPMTPILFIDWWEGDFLDDAEFEIDHKMIEMFHALKIHIAHRRDGTRMGTGWTVSKDGTSAVWDKGFQAFLNAPAELQEVLKQLKFRLEKSCLSRLAGKLKMPRRK